MKGKTLLILLLATGFLAALWFFRFGDEKHTGELKMGDKLFTELPVNAVAAVTIADLENTVTLVRGDKVWQVESRNGYPADFDELRDMVVKLSRLKIGRRFSGSPESLKRLSLMPPSASDTSATGKQVTLKDASGKILADVIFGQTRQTDDGGSGGQYLKKADADTVFLVDGNFRFLKADPAQWLKKEILNIKAEDVSSVTCYNEGGRTPVYTLSRPEKGEPARMAPVPPERTADSAKIDQVFDALSPLTLDDVRMGDGEPPQADAGRTRLVYRLFDGRQISIFPEFDGKESYTVRVAADAPAEQADTPAGHDPAEKEGGQSKTEATEADAAAPAVESVQQINDRLDPWIFSIKKWQYDSFITQPDLLLESVEKKGEGTS